LPPYPFHWPIIKILKPEIAKKITGIPAHQTPLIQYRVKLVAAPNPKPLRNK
jgi:hypothetical protein